MTSLEEHCTGNIGDSPIVDSVQHHENPFASMEVEVVIPSSHEIGPDLLDGLKESLTVSDDPKVVLEACRLLSNIMDGAEVGKIKAFAEEGIIKSLLDLADIADPVSADPVILTEASKVLSQVVSSVMLAQDPRLISTMIEEIWDDNLISIANMGDKRSRLVCLRGFRKVLENYHPKINNLGVEDKSKRFDPIETAGEACSPRGILCTVLKIREAVEDMCFSTDQFVSNSAADCIEHFWMSHRLCKQPGMEYLP